MLRGGGGLLLSLLSTPDDPNILRSLSRTHSIAISRSIRYFLHFLHSKSSFSFFSMLKYTYIYLILSAKILRIISSNTKRPFLSLSLSLVLVFFLSPDAQISLSAIPVAHPRSPLAGSWIFPCFLADGSARQNVPASITTLAATTPIRVYCPRRVGEEGVYGDAGRVANWQTLLSRVSRVEAAGCASHDSDVSDSPTNDDDDARTSGNGGGSPRRVLNVT